jgi:hypothetical protein
MWNTLARAIRRAFPSPAPAVAPAEQELDRLIAEMMAKIIGQGRTPLAGKLGLAEVLVREWQILLDGLPLEELGGDEYDAEYGRLEELAQWLRTRRMAPAVKD